MDEHAKKIWRAWVDGHIVQYKLFGKWEDDDPSNMTKNRQPDSVPNCWRIKPATKIVTCKIAFLDFGEGFTGIEAVIPDYYEEKEEQKEFVQWITDEMNIEVNMEQ